MPRLRSPTLLIGLVAALPCGCRRAPAPAPATHSAAPAVVTATPEAATRTLVTLLREHLAAVARGARTEAEAYRDLAIEQVAARDEIARRYVQQFAARKQVDPRPILERFVESWAAALSYYAAGIRVDEARQVRQIREWTFVEMPATGARGEPGVLRLACIQVPDGTWRVLELEITRTPLPPTQPASAPSTTRATATTTPAHPGPAQ